MLKKNVVLSWFLFLAWNVQSQEQVQLTIKPSIGIDLSDSHMGSYANGSRNFANTYSLKVNAVKNWYGLSAFYTIYNNSYHSKEMLDAKIPEISSGGIGGINALIVPVQFKRFELAIGIGVLYGYMNKLDAYKYIVYLDGHISNVEYNYLESRGFGFNWEINVAFPITSKFAIEFDFCANDFTKGSKMTTFLIADIGCRFLLN